MDLRKIKKLIELVEDSTLTELEIREGEESVRLSRISQSAPIMTTMPTAAAAPVLASPTERSADEDAGSSAESRFHSVTSPVVGTYYASADPDTPPFVEIGTSVKIGDTLCIIEAMKIFNAIEADRTGTIQEIKKENGDPVEFGEVLFLID